MSDPIIIPSMNLYQIAKVLQEHSNRNTEVSLKVNQVDGEPIAFLVREDPDFIPPYLRKRA